MPAVYTFLFVGDASSLVGLIVAGSCIILLIEVFKSVKLWLFVCAMATLFCASLMGICFQFRHSGESGPLPYEWLNKYYVNAIPLLVLSGGFRFWRHRAGKMSQSSEE